jgi:hypothetical protein
MRRSPLHSPVAHPGSPCSGWLKQHGVGERESELGADFGSCPAKISHSNLAAHSILSPSEKLDFGKRVLVMSLPFRFKAGGTGGTSNMASIHAGVHHHRSTTKQIQKPFKSRFASKSALKDLAKGFAFYCLV